MVVISAEWLYGKQEREPYADGTLHLASVSSRLKFSLTAPSPQSDHRVWLVETRELSCTKQLPKPRKSSRWIHPPSLTLSLPSIPTAA